MHSTSTTHTANPQSTHTTHITDPRLLNLSYSSLLTAHSCPRKFQLDRLGSTSDSSESISESITFSYGHVVGLGIQMLLEEKTEEDITWAAFLEWEPDLFAENIKQNKSFAAAIFAIQKFSSLLTQGYLNGYSLCSYQGKPACELSFLISLPGGYKYRGFVDAVLKNDETGEVLVLECKTSSATTLNPATYKNSAQAIGYSIVLDAIFPALSSYKVLYLVYSTKQLQYDQLEFSKSYTQRARWIQELILDIETLKMYEEHDLYPMRGESCFSYFRECQYMNLCQMSTDRLTQPATLEQLIEINAKNAEYQIQVTLEQLIHSQIDKAIQL